MADPRITPATTAGKVIKCKAAVSWGPRKPLRIQEVEVAPPQKMEVRVKVLFTCFCLGDAFAWSVEGPWFPRIIGHEGTGVVESVGEGVTGVVAGDTVMIVCAGECGECAYCKSEESNLCSLPCFKSLGGLKVSKDTSRFSVEGRPVYHYATTSTFTEYTNAHVGCVVKINPEAPMDKVCALSCGVISGLGAVFNVAKPPEDSSVAIFGLGLPGLAAAEAARIAGASQIIGVDSDSDRLSKALDFGITYALNSSRHTTPIHDLIVDITGEGADRSVVCISDPKYITSAFECLHTGWGIAVLDTVMTVEFSTDPLNFIAERTLKGCFFGNYKPRSHLPSLVDMIVNGELDTAKFVNYRCGFAEINEALLQFAKAKDFGVFLCIIAME
ncbi:unnamed protein product [Cuscuta campestris]|uniref:Alcohol dehydrogenase 1 n=1 Tax=Cuscuta campestris TaxID=132261 RepID=A0A484LYB0_9ASTE|nr:unnamed protein product [Cuscuta campestris]